MAGCARRVRRHENPDGSDICRLRRNLTWHRPRNRSAGSSSPRSGSRDDSSCRTCGRNSLIAAEAPCRSPAPAPDTVRLVVAMVDRAVPAARAAALPRRPSTITRGWRLGGYRSNCHRTAVRARDGRQSDVIGAGAAGRLSHYPAYSACNRSGSLPSYATSSRCASGLAALVVRYRRGSEVERRQLLWLLLAVLVALIVILPWGLVAGTPVEVLFGDPAHSPCSHGAIVRHELLTSASWSRASWPG